MGFQEQNSVAFLVKEDTENVLKAPSASDGIALQEAPALDPGNSPLENAEFTGGLDLAEPIAGPFAPSLPLSHYLRHSGTEGQAPNYGLLLEMAFGAVKINSTEEVTIAGSTAGTASARAVVKLGASIGLTFDVGEGLLIKDGANGYNIRCIHEITTDDLGLNFNLDSAPGTGIGLGKAVFYQSVDSGHPTASFWDYRANEAAIQAASGLRVASASFEPSAEELINSSFTLQGLDLAYNPIVITATNKFIDWIDDAGTNAASVAEKVYKNPLALFEALATAMNAVGSDVVTIAYDNATGKPTLTTDGTTTFDILWDTGANAANTIGATIGFDTSADDTGASPSTGYTADNALSYVAPVTGSIDDEPPLVAVDNEILLGTFNDFECISTRSLTVTFTNTIQNTPDMCEESGKKGSSVVSRESSVSLILNVPQHRVSYFTAMTGNTDVAFQWAFGKKDGARNWIPGRCGVYYQRQAKVSTHTLGSADSEVTLEITINGFKKKSETAKTAYMSLL